MFEIGGLQPSQPDTRQVSRMFKTLAICFDREQNVIERMLHNLRGSKQQRASHTRKHAFRDPLLEE